MVVDLALTLVDEAGPRGFDQLTLAGVAARAGVAVPSLYKHVGSLADLRREVAVVAVRGLVDAVDAATAGATGSDAVQRLARAVRVYARSWPGRYAATQVAPDATDPADEPLRLVANEAAHLVAEVLAGSGSGPRAHADALAGPGGGGARSSGATRSEPLTGAALVNTVRTVRAAVHGFVVLELGGGFGLPEDVDASFDHLVATLVAGLPRVPAGIA